ncbi:putative membrane protein [Clostridioides difficile CD149]|uniref:Uncharacterized protein n=1 Tax=Clostridioides difficile ATCC 9689 = DSM 1296 TaxID=1121308 RepID=A0ACA7UNT9_CLODI|nr:hypothetical protein [Clostridioides difficile]YP_009221686.1 hypothetical protein PHICD211_20086 [Clostridium phage phiCD211]AKP44763.1 hypothetical protein CDIF1296T_phi089 [Peptoclostridium phage phiCDIF1296T]EQE22596.1 putative membrane protein [Clostridioides difficile CD17]EQE57667.1 putative membrane protein [Clostridioides difficile CD43]EQE71193.1 putative membrane protein [Clostridioides difficile CD45]EQE96177.1 putative membrane protein [Clostridioides difficile CD129]
MILNIGAIFNLWCMLANYLWGSTSGMILNGFCLIALLLLDNNLD